MSWKTINRNEAVVDPKAPPVLSEAVREKIRGFFPRYETKRAVLLPALHIVQNTLGHLSWQAMKEVAEVLEIHPSEVMDTVSFYTHFWTHPKGKKVVTVCRSISCEVMGGAAVLEEVKRQLGINEHGTTSDGRYSLVTEECLAGCDHAPCLLINEKLHKRVKPQEVASILADADNDKVAMPRSALFDPPAEGGGAAKTDAHGPKSAGQGSVAAVKPERAASGEGIIGKTSDVREMREAD